MDRPVGVKVVAQATTNEEPGEQMTLFGSPVVHGGAGSGNFGHSGRDGFQGGSGPSGGGGKAEKEAKIKTPRARGKFDISKPTNIGKAEAAQARLEEINSALDRAVEKDDLPGQTAALIDRAKYFKVEKMTPAAVIKRGRQLKGTMDSQERKAEGRALVLRLEREGTEESKDLAERLRSDLKIPSAYDLEGGAAIDKLNS